MKENQEISIKVVLHCQASEGASDLHYGVNRSVHTSLEKMADCPIDFKAYGGYLSGNKLEKFLDDCQKADLVILDAWTHPEDESWYGRHFDACGEMKKIAASIKATNPLVPIFADLMEGTRKVAVHEYAEPVRSWSDEVMLPAINDAVANAKKHKQEKGGKIMKKMLVIDDKIENLKAAQEQIGNFCDLTIAQTFSAARNILAPKVNQDKKKEIKKVMLVEVGFAADFNPHGKDVKEEDRKKYWEIDNKADIAATPIVDFDIVMADVMMPGERDGQGPEGDRHVGNLMPIGLVAAILALKAGVKDVCLVSDTNHHSHPVAWALDDVNGSGAIHGFCGYDCPMVNVNGTKVKDWKEVLEKIS